MPKEIYIDENGNERILSSSPSALSGLLDTDITTPSANQVLAYNGSKWANTTLPNYCKLAYWSDSSVATYNVPISQLQQASGRPYGMALVFAWKEIFAIFYNNDNTVYATSLSSHGDRTLTIAYNDGNIVLTFSGTIWGGIGIIAV